MTCTEETLLKKIRIISASAGSGKTYQLTQEITTAIIDDGIDPSRILATTFTRKAAAELAERARTELLKAGRSADAETLSSARIGTVNAVCGRIAADYAFELGISPNTDVLDEQRARVAFKRCLAEVTTQAERAALEDIGRRFDDFDFKEDIRRITEQARTNGIEAKALAACADDAWAALAEVLGPVDTSIDHDAALLEAIEDAEARAPAYIAAKKSAHKGIGDAVRDIRAYKRNLKAGQLQWRLWIKIERTASKGVAKAEFFGDVITAAERFGSHPKFQGDLKDAIFLCYAIASRALAAYQAYKAARRAVDFIDQETLALELLNNDAVCARIAADIDVVFVDEFQDTSPLQLAIFLKLAEVAQRSVWVGDQKQAIFGFRGTDPALMDATVNAVQNVAQSNIDTLNKSYRSRPALVDSTSALFAPAFEAQSIARERTELVPALAARPHLGPAYERWVLKNNKNQDETAACLANAVADG